MKKIVNIPGKLTRALHPLHGIEGDEHNGFCRVKLRSGAMVRVLFSDGMGWDHVSISTPSRTPTWDEMCELKDLFFEEEDLVVQFHPPRSDYVNLHQHTLHLWRLQYGDMPRPDSIMVG